MTIDGLNGCSSRSSSATVTIHRPPNPKQEIASRGSEPDEEADVQGPPALRNGRAEGSLATIELLPPELLLYLSHFLDLAGLIVLSTATSRTLRSVFGQFDRELLFLEPSHRLNLGEWRDAARQIESYALTRQDAKPARSGRTATSEPEACSPAKGQMNLDAAMFELTRDESLIDLDLFKAVLDFLSRGETRQHQDVPRGGNKVQTSIREPLAVNKIRCLYLTGWHGMAGTFLIQQLRSHASLRNVSTIVKTERADTRIWQHAAVEDQALRTQTRSTDRDWVSAKQSSVSRALLGRQPIQTPSSIPSDGYQEQDPYLLGFERCTSTQIIVQVGRRRLRREGQPYLRGEGLQMGYQGYCIDVVITSPDLDRDAADTGGNDAKVRLDLLRCSGAETELEQDPTKGSGEGTLDTDTCVTSTGGDEEILVEKTSKRRLHVILQGREEIGTKAEDRMENEEMFERSIVICNRCKERIKF